MLRSKTCVLSNQFVNCLNLKNISQKRNLFIIYSRSKNYDRSIHQDISNCQIQCEIKRLLSFSSLTGDTNLSFVIDKNTKETFAAKIGENLDLNQFLDSSNPEFVTETVQAAAKITEGFIDASHLGLSPLLPPAFISNLLQHLHDYVPWWGTIAIATVFVRVLLFPLIVKSQIFSANMAKLMPEMQLYQQKLTTAQERRDAVESEIYLRKLSDLMRKNNFQFARFIWIPMANATIFSSFFFALRALSEYPVYSMKTGGLFWFVDLSQPDPYYVLPFVTASTLFIIFKLGIEFNNNTPSANQKVMKFLTYGAPLACFCFALNFPSALSVYWCTSNIISLGQSLLLKNNNVRQKLGIPKLEVPVNQINSENKISFKEGFNESWKNISVAQKLHEKQELEEKIKLMKKR